MNISIVSSLYMHLSVCWVIFKMNSSKQFTAQHACGSDFKPVSLKSAIKKTLSVLSMAESQVLNNPT